MKEKYAAFFITIALILLLTLKPYQFSTSYLVYDDQFWKSILLGFGPLDMISNILLFLPFGISAALIFKQKKLVLINGIVLSLMVECSQLFLDRVTSIADVLTNGIGALIGAAIANWSINFLRHKKIMSSFIAGYLLLASLFIISPFWLNNFSNWAPDYYLLVGNEATLNRQWEGTIASLAIYNSVVNESTVREHFKHGPTYCDSQAVVYYHFNEREAQNEIANGIPGLVFSTDALITKESTVSIQRGVFKSTRPAEELAAFLKSTNKLTLEAWIKPANLTQTGPARILSFSANPEQRNFTLGQVKDAVSLRVRTPLNGRNGSRCEFISEKGALTTTHLQHIVASYNRGNIKFYVDGHKVNGRCDSVFGYLPVLTGFGASIAGSLLFYITLLIPIVWLFLGYKLKDI